MRRISVCGPLAVLLLLTFVAGTIGENPPERYAVIVAGTGSCTGGTMLNSGDPMLQDGGGGSTEHFYYDVTLIKELLVQYYCFKPGNVFTLYGGGFGNDPRGCERYGGGAYEEFTGPAVYDTLRTLLYGLADGDTTRGLPKIDGNDMFFLWTFNHGCYYDQIDGAKLGLGYWVGVQEVEPEDVRDNTLKTWVDRIGCDYRIVWMNQCYSGGFITELSGNPNKCVMVTADGFDVCSCCDDVDPDAGDSLEMETCPESGIGAEHGEFNYHMMNALRGETVQENYVDADTNDDGWVSLEEAYSFACLRNSIPGDSPQRSGRDLAKLLTFYGRKDRGAIRTCQDTTFWSGPVYLYWDVTIPSGHTLVIKPGTVIKCDKVDKSYAGQDTTAIEIIVEGELYAAGTAESTIKFTSMDDPAPGQMGQGENDHWWGIRFKPGSSGTLEHAIIKRAEFGALCDSAGPSFKYCSIYDNQQAGIKCAGNAAPDIGEGTSLARIFRGILCLNTSQPTIHDSVVVDSCNIGIFAKGSSSPTIRDCEVKRCQKGISVVAGSDPDSIKCCNIHNNWDAGLFINTDGTNTLTVDGCDVYDNPTYGIQCTGTSDVVVQNTEVYDNEEGVSVYGTAQVLLGKDATGEAGYNNIYGNSVCNVRNATTSGDTLYAENCWWGQAPPDTSKICGVVDYVPYLTEEVDLAPPFSDFEWEEHEGSLISLGPLVPNPLNGHVTIAYRVMAPGSHVSVKIVNVLGQTVSTVTDQWKGPGQYTVTWNRTNDKGSRVEAGVYFCVLHAGDMTTQSKKVVVVGHGLE